MLGTIGLLSQYWFTYTAVGPDLLLARPIVAPAPSARASSTWAWDWIRRCHSCRYAEKMSDTEMLKDDGKTSDV